jgi:hypothetical protein
MKTARQKVVRTRANNTWTEARFWAFIRSGLRGLSMRWPPRQRALNNARRNYSGPIARKRYEYQCAACGAWGFRESVEVDHVEECGSLKSYNDLPGFVSRLLCEADNLVVLCKACHKVKE